MAYSSDNPMFSIFVHFNKNNCYVSTNPMLNFGVFTVQLLLFPFLVVNLKELVMNGLLQMCDNELLYGHTNRKMQSSHNKYNCNTKFVYKHLN